jgi:dipeptidyl aminopeptidase/acylaminoacyl peptidase
MNVRLAALLTIPLIASSMAATDARPYTPRDAVALVVLGTPKISPNGERIAFLVTHSDYQRNARATDLAIYAVAGGTADVVRHDVPGIGAPQWSPDGSRLAYVRDVEGKSTTSQIVIDALTADTPAPATAAPQGVDQFAWSPSGSAIAYSSADAVAPGHGAADAFEAGDGGYLDHAALPPEHLYVVDLATERTRRLTSGSWTVASQPIAWTSNAREIIFTKVANTYGADNYRSTLAAVDTVTCSVRALTQHRAVESAPALSPDGTKLAYLYQHNGDAAGIQDLFVTTPDGGNGKPQSGGNFDVNVAGATWFAGTRALLVGANAGSLATLWVKPLGAPARRLPLGTVEPNLGSGLAATISRGGAIAFLGGDQRDPMEIYYLRGADAKPVAITSYNRPANGVQIGAVREISWRNDGFAEDGILTFPPGYDARRSYPLVLRIHGGPVEASTLGLSGLNQTLAAAGWIVFSPNYRGSDNLGERYAHAIVGDATAGPGRDVMAGLAAVERNVHIDRRRIAISGWSYGGLLTSWLIAHGNGWRAAVSGGSPNNLVEQYALTTLQWRFQFGGRTPWRGAYETYVEQSPLTYAARVRTPTLFMTDLRDGAVAMTSSYEMYRALKDNGVETQLWVYPLAGHMPSDPVHIVDYFERWVAWIRSHFS